MSVSISLETLSVCVHILLLIAVVSGVSVVLNSTTVIVSWSPVNLPVVDHYTVHYAAVTVSGLNDTATFPASASSGVVSGLQGGQQYQFSVSVTLLVTGVLYTGREFLL